MKLLFRILVVCIFAGTATNGSEAAENDFQTAKRAYDKRNYATVIKLLLPLAEGGDAKAQHLLARTYDFAQGQTGVKSDNTKAQFWYEKAVQQDYLPAIRDLGAHLVREFKNVKRGYGLLKTAAERGDAGAQLGLGIYLASSDWGLPVDRAKARTWLLKSIGQKYAYAATRLHLMYRRDGDTVESYKWDIIGQFLTTKDSLVKGPLILPDIREKMTESQVAESQRRAKVWLQAHGEKP